MLTRGLRSIALALVLATLAWGEGSGSLFKSDDRWCAVGDSITHGGSYHKYVYLFYTTRFPNQRLEFFNCGISGDTASGALRRLDGDILRHKPTVATIMLGMNDVGRDLYGDGKEGASIQQQRQSRFDSYAANMKTLAGKLKASGARLVFITPSPYDQTVVLDAPPKNGTMGVNDGLGRFAHRVRELAGEFQSPVIDFHKEMGRIVAERQAADPHFTLLRPDRVHPVDTGHFVMAYLFLKAQEAPQLVSRIGIDAAKGEAADPINCRIENLQVREGGVSFTCTENALPFPVGAEAKEALKIVPFANEMNREMVQIKNLPAGGYTLRIDDQVIGDGWTAGNFADGIDIASQANTPQNLQAMEVMKINDQRQELIRGQLRVIEYIEFKSPPPNGAADEAYMEVIRKKAAGGKPGDYVAMQYKTYLKFKPRQSQIVQELNEAVEQMWKAAAPRPHAFVIRPVDRK